MVALNNQLFMKTLGLTICFLLSYVLPITSQVLVKGRVKSENDQDVIYASIRLLRPDSSFVQGTITDSIGNYCLRNVYSGDYLLSISSIGYISQWHVFSHHDDEQLGAVVPESGAAQTDDRAEEDGDASQHGDRLALQLARVGVVDDVLVEGNLDQQRMNPPDAQQGNQERENEWHKYVYLSRDAWTCRAASGIWAIGTSRQGEIERM